MKRKAIIKRGKRANTTEVVKPSDALDLPPKMGQTSEKQIAEALRASMGVQCDAAALLNITPQAVGERIKKSKYLQKVRSDIRYTYIDKALNIIRKELHEENPQIAMFCLKKLGWLIGWQERMGIDVDGKVGVALGVVRYPASMSEEEKNIFVAAIMEANPGASFGLLPAPYDNTEEGRSNWEKSALAHQKTLLGSEEEGEEIIDVEEAEEENLEELEGMEPEEEDELNERGKDFFNVDLNSPLEELSEKAQRRQIHEQRSDAIDSTTSGVKGF